MNAKVLLVDDDKNLLVPMAGNLRQKYDLDTASGGEEGLGKLKSSGPFAVVVSDRQMPGMDGIQFLSLVKEQAPDTVRIMLTGNADLEHAVRVVNEGNIFRFLTKPCHREVLLRAVDDAVAQHRLIVAEKELLNKTLNGSIKLLTDILSLVDAKSFNRSEKLRTLITGLAPKMSLAESWEINVAAMLSPVGYVTLPHEAIVKSRAGQPLSKGEQQLLNSVPEITGRLLSNIPRLEGVAKITLYQRKHFDGTGFPVDNTKGEAIPAGARVLKILNDMLDLQASGKTQPQALDELATRSGFYDMQLLHSVRTAFGVGDGNPIDKLQAVSVLVNELKVGMILLSDVVTNDKLLILSAGHLVNETVLEKIQNFNLIYGIQEPILVKPVPSSK
jgi:response regulator RpfG family c-di-GMP phosphodiesterase